jgi:hypothetical protein
MHFRGIGIWGLCAATGLSGAPPVRRQGTALSPDSAVRRVVSRIGGEWRIVNKIDTAQHIGRPSSGTEMPFASEDARLYVPVTSGGPGPGWFILDTGAGPTLVDAATADALKVATTAAGTTTGAGAGATDIRHSAPVSLQVGSLALGPLQANVAPLDSMIGPSSGRAIPGIVGSRFFIEPVGALSFERLRLHAPDPASHRSAGPGVAVPIDVDGGVPLARGWLTTPAGKRVPMRLLVDLGAKATLLLTEPFIRANDLRSAFPHEVESGLGAGMGGATRYAFTRVLSIGLDGPTPLRADSIVAGLSVNGTLRSEAFDGLLGADFLSRYHVIFDYARRRMILAPRAVPERFAEFDMAGVYLLGEGPAHRRYRIDEVRANSPAARAGLRVGDEVVEADGKPASAYSLSDLRDLLRSGDGRVVRLAVFRDSSVVRVAVTLKQVL